MEDAVRRGTGNPNFKLNPQELKLLRDTVNAANAGNIAGAQKLIPSANGERAGGPQEQQNNRFSFALDPNRRIDVIKPEMEKARKAAWSEVERAAAKNGWTSQETAAYKKQFYDSNEMAGLASLKFNMGEYEPIPKTADAIVTGDRARAVYEIEIRTNAGKDNGIANRRVEDAKFLSEAMTDKDKAALGRLIKANQAEVNAYQKAFGPAFQKSTTGQRAAAPLPLPPQRPQGSQPVPSPTPAPAPKSSPAPANPPPMQIPMNNDGATTGDLAALSPERSALVADLTKTDGPLDDILLKNPADLTRKELAQVMEARQSAAMDEDRDRLFKIETAHFEDKFGTAPVETDATGRMVETAPIRPTRETSLPARDRDGKPLAETLGKLAKAVTSGIDSEGAVETVKALQTGLNVLNRMRTDKLAGKKPDVSPLFRDLKDDGEPGPKTRAAFKTATARLGPAKVKEGLALGRFRRFAQNRTSGSAAGDLNRIAESAFGSLFRKQGSSPAQPVKVPKPSATGFPTTTPPIAPQPKRTEEGFGLQATINDLGRTSLRDTFKPIKEDGWIGPKTETAFSQLLPAVGADAFTSSFGGNLGFFDDDFGD